MPHESGHVIITFNSPINSAKPKVKVWHCALALLVVGIIIGAVVF